MKEYIDEDSSTTAKTCMLGYVIISLILCGGSVFGFTPLKEILLDEGIYHDLCDGDPGPPLGINLTNVDDDDGVIELYCDSQLVQLDTMFTLAASLFSAYLMPAGFCLRFLGPRTCFLAGFAFVILGSMGFALASSDYFTMAYVLIGTGNPLLYISAFNFAKLYPQSSNLLLSIFIGCFGFSSVVFYVFNLIHFAPTLQWSSRTIFGGFTVLPFLLGMIGWFVLPTDPYHIQREKKLARMAEDDDSKLFVPAEAPTETTPLKTSTSSSSPDDTETTTAITTAEKSDIIPLKDRSTVQQLQSPQFLAQTLFFCWGMLHQNFYLATIGDQLYMFAGNNHPELEQVAANILTHFAVLYPMGCIAAILPVGALVRNCSVATSLWVYCLANLAFSSLALVPNVHIQWATSGLYVMVRVGFFTVMSTYSSTMFGFPNLGTMFGCAGCLAGLFSLLGTLLSDRALHVDHSFIPINSVLWAGSVLNLAFPAVIQSYKW